MSLRSNSPTLEGSGHPKMVLCLHWRRLLSGFRRSVCKDALFFIVVDNIYTHTLSLYINGELIVTLIIFMKAEVTCEALVWL